MQKACVCGTAMAEALMCNLRKAQQFGNYGSLAGCRQLEPWWAFTHWSPEGQPIT